MIITKAKPGATCRHTIAIENGLPICCGKPAVVRLDHPGLKPDWLCAGCLKTAYPSEYGEVSGDAQYQK